MEEKKMAYPITPADETLIICRCEEVSRGEIIQALNEGARTTDEVKRRTRAGMGLCQSKTCRKLVQNIIAEVTKQPMAEILPFTGRGPVRPELLSVLATLADRKED